MTTDKTPPFSRTVPKSKVRLFSPFCPTVPRRTRLAAQDLLDALEQAVQARKRLAKRLPGLLGPVPQGQDNGLAEFAEQLIRLRFTQGAQAREQSFGVVEAVTVSTSPVVPQVLFEGLFAPSPEYEACQ